MSVTPPGSFSSSRRRLRDVRPDFSAMALVITDLATVATTAAAALGIRMLLPGAAHVQVNSHLQAWPFLLTFPLFFAATGLYRPILMHPADELRRTTWAISLAWILAAAGLNLIRLPSEYWSRLALVLTWAMLLATVPLARYAVRRWCGHREWWGRPVIVLGAGETGRRIVQRLQSKPSLGLKPRIVLDDDPTTYGNMNGVPVTGPLERAIEEARAQRIEHVIVAMPEADSDRLHELESRLQTAFTHFLVVPNLCGVASLWVQPCDVGGLLALEVRRNLLMPIPRICKRTLDLTLCLIGLIPFLILVGIIALAIRVDSRGPVFYSQERIGRDGRKFRAWKFRSMVRNADAVLAEHLAQDPRLKAEWEADHKLRHDPRITRVGRLLRITSLDELPQVFNVIHGTMSLVGPRPIVDAEVEKYGPVMDLYIRVRPGLSGLWQVSGRNNTTYAERIAMDSYYVRNWSIWLDLVLLAATVRVVLRREGAY